MTISITRSCVTYSQVPVRTSGSKSLAQPGSMPDVKHDTPACAHASSKVPAAGRSQTVSDSARRGHSTGLEHDTREGADGAGGDRRDRPRRQAAARQAEEAAQAAILRCLFGNPFHPLPPRSFPAHVLVLARECAEAFPTVSDQFSLLGDALLDLGEEEAAAHCRREVHGKGCHVLDWVLGEG